MNTIIFGCRSSKRNFAGTACCLILFVGSFSLPALAQMDTSAERSNSSVQQKDSLENPLNFSAQHGTSELQLKVLTEINHDLMAGSLSPEQAGDYKTELNKINDQESGYQSLGHLIPRSLVEKDTREIRAIGAKLHRVPPLKTSGTNALHLDVDDMIGQALAQNKISSSEAEKYYLRLAQIESNIESAKSDKGSGRYDAAAMSKSLAQLRAELSRY